MRQVIDFFLNLFEHSDFFPQWETGYWTGFHGWLYILSDILICAAFFVSPILVFRYIRRQGRKVHLNSLYFLFLSFILLNGTVYLLDAVGFWLPFLRMGALVRLLTAVASWFMIYYVIQIIPIALSLKSPQELQLEVDRRTNAERELKVKNGKLVEAERTAKFGYGNWNIKRGQVELSEMAYYLLGIPHGAKISYESLTEHIHPADLRFVEESLKQNLMSSSFQEFYFRVVSNTLQIKHLLVKGEVIRNAIGEALFLKATVQDVSELRTHMLRIEQQNRRLKKIAWVQSHRMRSPVASILGMVELFNFDDPSDPMNADILTNIKELTVKLDEIIHEVDELTREKAGQA